MKKAIVFGGAGFIGSHVADALSDANYKVTIFDIKKSEYLKETQTMIVGNINDQNAVSDAIKGNQIVFHFSGIADLDDCLNNPYKAAEVNILGTIAILDACVNHSIERLIFASSAYVYSANGGIYKNTKQSCELFIETYYDKFNLNYTIIRYGSLYGPRSDTKNSIHRLLKDALETKEIIYHGTGEEKRDYIHVSDAANLTLDILSEQYKNNYVLLTGTQTLYYKELLTMISEILNNEITITYKENTRDAHYTITPYSFQPKTAKKLICNPFTDFGQGLIELLQELHNK